MKNKNQFLPIVILSAFAFMTLAQTAHADGTDPEPRAKSPVPENVQKLQDEAQLTRALAEKLNAEIELERLQIKRQFLEKLCKAQGDADMEKLARSKAEEEAAHVGARARFAEETLREMKAKAEIANLSILDKGKN